MFRVEIACSRVPTLRRRGFRNGLKERELSLSYEITGHKPHLQGAFSRTVAASATAALRIARQWAEQGMTGITIVTPKGESYDLDNFGMIVSTKDEESHPDQT
jgi:hypothetical protein